jgi:polyhydroxybutyrate depolymerase
MSSKALFSVALVASSLAVGCSEEASSGSGGSTSSEQSASGTGASTSTGVGGQVTDDFVAGGDREVTVNVPSSYDPSKPAPLLILLHGYTASGALQEIYFKLEPITEERGIVYAHPDGMADSQGNQFWNATDACCNFGTPKIDDSKYLIDLVNEIKSRVNIDPKRVYFVGHSNGGFMSYRMACDHADDVAAIVSLAGATFNAESDCKASSAVSILQIHGTMDATISYGGGMLLGNAYPGAIETTNQWRMKNQCESGTPQPITPDLDLDTGIAGAETKVTRTDQGCAQSSVVELWTITGGAHIPTLDASFGARVIDFLLAHPKP